MAAEQLADYELQLDHVEAAILAEPENEELQKLKEDLLEVITLTKELLADEAGPAGDEEKGPVEKQPAPPPRLTAVPLLEKPARDWKSGDRCLATYSKNGKFYEAIIEAVKDDQVTVNFVGFETRETNNVLSLRKLNDHDVSKLLGKQSKIKLFAEQRDKRREKALKRVQKQKQLELTKEAEKTKWHDFAKKASAKSYRGVKRPPTSGPQAKETRPAGSGRHVAGVSPRF